MASIIYFISLLKENLNTSINNLLNRNFRGREGEVGPKKPKKCVFISTCLNFTYLKSNLHLIQYSYPNFVPLFKIVFFNSSILMPFSASAILCLFHIGKMFPSEDPFYPRKQTNKKCHLGWDGVNSECRA